MIYVAVCICMKMYGVCVCIVSHILLYLLLFSSIDCIFKYFLGYYCYYFCIIVVVFVVFSKLPFVVVIFLLLLVNCFLTIQVETFLLVSVDRHFQLFFIFLFNFKIFSNFFIPTLSLPLSHTHTYTINTD